MGTDIHLRVEKKDENGVWQYVKPPRTWSIGDMDYPTPTWDDDYTNWSDPDVLNPEGRHYNLFAFLADVRNGVGFAGVYTGDRVEPQFPFRGVPDDAACVHEDDHWLGDHSFTWATLTELLAAPWDIKFTSGGFVNEREYEAIDESGVPTVWCADIVGKNIVKLTPLQYNEMIAEKTRDESKQYYIFWQWDWQPLINCDFKRWLERDLVPLASGDTDTIRVLMGFDS